MSSNQSGEAEIRRNIIEADLVDCMISLPPQLSYGAPIPACLWFLAWDKRNGKFRNHRGETLFIDAHKIGHMIDRVHREFSDEDISRIAGVYHAWRGEANADAYQDIPGFCKSATIEEIATHNYVFTPGRYVGAEDIADEDEPFEEKMTRLTEKLEKQFQESAKLEDVIRQNLKELGCDA